MRLSLTSLVLPALFLRLGNTASPRALAWSSQRYGPDGPWQAVTINLGSDNQVLDLYPGSAWHSNILAASIYSNASMPVCYAQTAGTFDSSTSSSVLTYPVSSTVAQIDWTSGAMALTGIHTVQFDTATITPALGEADLQIPNLSLQVILAGYYTLPNGTAYMPEVGTLAMGGENINQSYPQVNGVSNFNSSLLSGYLYAAGQISSNSYGLHIGSASLGIPGSAFVGGYDQSRVLGVVSTQSTFSASSALPIDLLDIGIGVAEGRSPFNFTSKSGLLAQGNSSIGVSLQVLIEATIPYLYFPRSTCDAIASQLPVTYQSDYGLYFWDTDDPQYALIVSSPSYLSFTFRLDQGNSDNMTINVPFKLLNLTLDAPLVTTPTPYFPCRPLTDGGSFTLGRAFLQAAFVGVNWMSGANTNDVWFLAQAPGPNTASTAVATPIEVSDTTIGNSTNGWIDSWKGVWTVIDSANQTASTNSTSQPISASSTHISDGAIAGIVVGAILVLVLLALVIVLCVRRRRPRTASVGLRREYNMLDRNPGIPQKDDSQITEARMHELEISQSDPYVELENSQRAELDGHWAPELEGPPVRVELEETGRQRPSLL